MYRTHLARSAFDQSKRMGFWQVVSSLALKMRTFKACVLTCLLYNRECCFHVDQIRQLGGVLEQVRAPSECTLQDRRRNEELCERCQVRQLL